MSTSIIGFGQSTPATNFSVSQVEGAQLPPGGPQPPPASLPAAVSDSRIATDTYSQSQAAAALLASSAPQSSQTQTNTNAPAAAPSATPAVSTDQAASVVTTTQAQNPSTAVVAQNTTSNANDLQEFEQSEAPPPYTLATAVPNPDKENSRALVPAEFSPFQIRQFSDLVKTLRSITSAVLPNFSYSA